MIVYLLTESEKDSIVGKQFAPSSIFNPIQDFYDQWVISKEEVEYCINIEFLWIKNLPQIEYIPKIYDEI
jgi:hypothetical protein